MSEQKIPYKIYLSESEIPEAWYNVRADMKTKPAPLLNPGTGLSLNIDEHSNALDFELATDVAPYFGIDAAESAQIVDSIKRHVADWRKWAMHYHIPREEQELMAPAFRVE